ncbi:MAG: hypothetical protein K9J17_01505 [Flavobacteriales bacterium]|nr:hypothetical protein [Flavobacteriales bacterium]
MRLLNKLKEPWGFMRMLRLALGLFTMIDAVQHLNWLLMAVSAVLLYQGVMNVSCVPCQVAGNCAVPEKQASDQDSEEVVFEKVN